MDINNSRIVKYLGQGNGLAVNHCIEEGDIIIGIGDPFLIIVENGALDRVCSQCLMEAASGLKRCTACKVVQYCSLACQSTAWKTIHKEECRILKKLPQIPPTAVRGVMQLLLRKAVVASPTVPPWVRLESHATELQRSKRWDDIILQAKAAVEWTASPREYIESAVNVLCRMATNAFRVTLADSTPIGLCFEPSVSFANHSCMPNSAIMFDGRHMTLRALDPIKEGEQISISYIDVTQTRDERRRELKDRYFFTCCCNKCERDYGPYRTFLKSTPVQDSRLELFHGQKNIVQTAQARCSESPAINVPTLLSDVNGLLSRSRDPSTSPSAQLSLLKDALAMSKPLNQYKLFAQTPYPLILNEIYLHYLTTSTYAKALSVLLFIYLNCDLYNYPQPHHPIRVTRLFSIAKLLKSINGIPNIDLVSANQTLLICVRNLGVKSHGVGSRFMCQVEEEIGDVEAVQRTRGDVGLRLAEWGKEEPAEAGMEYARKIFEGLRILAEDALIDVL